MQNDAKTLKTDIGTTRKVGKPLQLLGEMKEPDVRPRLAVAGKGFRPFFLAAGAFAAVIVPLWLLALGGEIRLPLGLDPATWHAHEMIFGFAVAVIAGFLLTAVGNWTQRETLIGPPLLGLLALWSAGRAVMAFSGALPLGLVATVDLAFLPVLVVVLARPLIATNSRRNFVMLGILAALFAANVAVHGDMAGLLAPGVGRRACLAGVHLVVLVILVIAGRVFPMFTRNGTGVQTVRSLPKLDIAAIVAMGLFTGLDVVAPERDVTGVVAAVAGLLAAARAVHWGAQHTLGKPLLWILHAGYAFIPIGLLLRAATWVTPLVTRSAAVHALTVGAVGSLTLGMMARVSLGHSGRVLEVGRAVSWSFAAVVAASLARLVGSLLPPAWYFASLVVSGVLWVAAFATFVVVYSPILTSPRIDGKAG